MAKLSTTYMGLELKNPLIVSSSGLTSSINKIKEIHEQGAGAIVLKSLFEEQINVEANHMVDEGSHTEALDYIKYYTKSRSVDDYLKLIKDAKEAIDIPVIASINCITANEWIEFAKKIEKAGADALELNVFFVPNDKNAEAEEYEEIYFELAEKIQRLIQIPVAFKMGSYFTNLTRVVNKLSILNIPAVVLFNRFYSPDIDVDTLEFKSAETFSNPSDLRQSLRWVGMLSGMIKDIDIGASTGVHDASAAIKMLLAGAKAVQVCSTLYKNGFGYINTIRDDMEKWMDQHNFESIDDFQGRMSYQKIKDPAIYERAQFMKYFSSVE